jgi:hypothetical protein
MYLKVHSISFLCGFFSFLLWGCVLHPSHHIQQAQRTAKTGAGLPGWSAKSISLSACARPANHLVVADHLLRGVVADLRLGAAAALLDVLHLLLVPGRQTLCPVTPAAPEDVHMSLPLHSPTRCPHHHTRTHAP